MADNFNLSIDEILSELSAEKKSSDAPKKEWSLDEIDSLLGLSPAKSTEPKQEQPVEEEPVVSAASEPMAPTTQAEPIAPAEPVVFEKETVEETIAVEENSSTEEKPTEPITQKTRVFDSNVIKITPRVKKAEDPELIYDPYNQKDAGNATFADEISENQTQIVMELADESAAASIVSQGAKTAAPQEEASAPADEKTVFEKKALAQKTVGIYPIRNENIDHQIVTEKIEKSNGGVMETDKFRERFLNVPRQKIERTADYELTHLGKNQDPIERDGRIIKKSKFTNTADLEPVPTIVSADAQLSNVDKAIVAGAANTILHDEEDGVVGQIKLVGFGEEEALEQIDEDHAEETLREKRDQKIASFKLDPDFAEIPSDAPAEEDVDEEEETETDSYSTADVIMSDFIDDEYEKPEDKDRIIRELSTARKATGICMIAQAVMTIVALVITGIISKSGGNLELIGGSSMVCGIINIVILLLAALCGVSTLIRGFKGLTSLKPNAASGTLIVTLSCLIENIAVTVFTAEAYTSVSLYTAAGCVALTLASLARFIALDRTLGNFEFVTNGTGLYSSEKISGEDDAFEIGRGLLIGNPEICYNAPMERPSYFIENSFEDDPADANARRLVLPITAVAFVAAIVFGIIRRDVVFAFGVFAAVCSIGIPAFSLVASNIALLFVNKSFNRNGAAIVGHRAVADSTDINAYVLDSTDIFKKGSCSIIGIKTFQQMRIDDAILYAAALVIESGGPLADIFDGVILGKKDLLPPVESLAYEEKLGLSAWIHGRRILLGTRDLLVNHNVQAPDKDFERQYTHDDRKVMYLAIAGKISAMFVIKYQADKHMRRYLQNVDRAGVSLLVRSCDCNITEEMICRFFNLPISAVKILSPVSGDIFQRYRTEEIETAPAGIIHDGTIEASLKSIYEARELNANVPVNNMISTIYSAIAIILFIILGVFAGSEGFGITGGQIVLFQLLWAVIASAVPVLKRRFDR